MVAKPGTYYSPRDVLGVFSLLTGPQPISCAASRFATLQGAERPLIPGSTLSKLGTCFMVGEMPGGKPRWFKVPSLERVLLLVLGGSSTPEHAAASGSTLSKLGTRG